MMQVGGPIRLFGADLASDESRGESSGAAKRARLPDLEVNYNTEKRQTGDASTSSANAEHGIEQSKTHCLLFEKNLPEFLFLFCLQCLEIGEKEERYLISNPDESDRQWVVRSINPLSHKGGDSFSGRETTPTYLCMHYTSRGVLPACKECIEGIIDSKHSRSQKGETGKMSRKSGLIFLTEKLPVQKVALQCDEFCDWVSGLTEDVCRLLQNIETMNSGDSQVPGQKVEEYHFVTAITYLSTKPVTSHLWYLQFKQGEGDMKEAFKDLAFCIAVVSNAYVVSVRLRYLIMSPFDYKHVATICNIPDIIRITHFDYVYSGIFPQPLSLQSITSSLGISGHTGPKIFISDRLEQ
ncbi:hypothetical protein ABG067_007276 [Albugo candida]